MFIKNIHSKIGEDIENTLRFGSKRGIFTKEQNFISGGFLPCYLSEKETELDAFINFYNKKPKNLNDALVNLAILSYWFAGIHIFSDANSRVGRFLTSYYLYMHNFTKLPYFTISKALKNIGGKEEFILAQSKCWISGSINDYVLWFLGKLLSGSWIININLWLENKF